MADITPTAPLGGHDARFGETRLTEVTDLALVSIAIPLGGEDALTSQLERAFALPLPDARTATSAKGRRLIRLSPDQLMLMWQDTDPDPARGVAAALDGTGYVTTQTGAWVALDLAGPLTLPALERVCPLALHPDSFPPGRFARTVMEHLSVVILNTGPDAMRLLSASSSAGSFLHMLETSLRNVSD
ncbi:sarcosine oxidase subunit gamma [Oceanibium sediminis]|uniref:sarcosine oxidase subunit gamma n=1 Tax=Oceanibium sediminis TaxID=2026339 RepID=UPI000DD3FEF4|nr:sarcosine oxidase subunit gamma [Oceanibium sediminis]